MPKEKYRKLKKKIMDRVRKQYPRYSLKRRQRIRDAIVYQRIRKARMK